LAFVRASSAFNSVISFHGITHDYLVGFVKWRFLYVGNGIGEFQALQVRKSQ
jgi:hypothetical protein